MAAKWLKVEMEITHCQAMELVVKYLGFNSVAHMRSLIKESNLCV